MLSQRLARSRSAALREADRSKPLFWSLVRVFCIFCRVRAHGIDGSGARIEKALRDLCKQNAEITISSVSRRAGVTRKSIYHRADLVSLIRAHRPLGAVTDDPPAPPVDAQTSIVAALRSRLAAKDAQIADLKASLRERDRTIAALHGELDKRIAASPG